MEGGESVAYFDRTAIVKIVATHFGEGGKTIEEYYYENAKLIFVFERVSHYDRPLSGRVVSTAENRFYFKDGNLIRWIDEGGNQVPIVNENFRLKQSELLANSARFTNGVRSKAPIIEASN